MSINSAQRLNELLRQQIERANELHQLLASEGEALMQRDVDAVEQLSRRKGEQSAELERLAQLQQTLLQEGGLPFTGEGLRQMIEAQPPSMAAHLSKLQQQLHSLLEQCQKINLVNGNIIAANQRSAETALQILRGQISPDRLTYSAGGQAIAAPSSRPAIKA